jgi:hypothetical protein
MPWLFTQWYHSPKVSPPKGSFDQRYCLTKGIAGFSQKVSSTQCHPEQQGAAFICVAHSAQGPAVRRLCASGASTLAVPPCTLQPETPPLSHRGGLDKATVGGRAFGKRLLPPVGSSAAMSSASFGGVPEVIRSFTDTVLLLGESPNAMERPSSASPRPCRPAVAIGRRILALPGTPWGRRKEWMGQLTESTWAKGMIWNLHDIS